MLNWRESRSLLQRAVRNWVEDGASTMGASLAFYTLFSLAPLLMVAIGIAGFVAGRDQAQAALINEVSRMIGEQAAIGVEDLLDRATRAEEGISPAIVGFVTLFFGAEFTRAYSHEHGSKSLARAANSDFGSEAAMVERARRIVKGRDPVLTQKRG